MEEVSDEDRPRVSPYAWFVGGVGSWALASGMHQVLYAWLVVGVLRETASWVGVAQMVPMLPSLFFLLAGGVLADRVDLRRLLLALHVSAAVTAAGLGAVVGAGHLSLAILLGYAAVWGTIQAFAGPARDSMISVVSGSDLMRAVTGVTLAQFLGVALGSQLGAVGGWLGNAAALGVQASVLVLGLVPVSRLARTAPHASAARGPALAAMRDGLREVRRSERLFPVALLVAANGLLFMGPFAVLCPLIVRDVYGGGIASLSLVMMALPLGTIAGSAAVLLRGGVRRKGRAFLLALLGVAVILVGFRAQPPFPVFVAAIFVWGVCHSVFFNTSRTLFQEAAPASHRARVLSVHSLGFLGLAPFSHLGAGLLASAFGPLTGCALAGGVMIAITALAFLRTPVRRLV